MFKKLNNKVSLPTKLKIYFIFVKNTTLLVIQTPYLTKKYIQIPRFLNIIKSENFLNLESNKKQNFNNFFSLWLKKFSKPFKKQLILKGLGFKGNIIDNSILELKLGFSHIIKVMLDFKELKISMNNNILTVEGFESDKVGNFLEKVKKLKPIDNFKGKGFWYKNESRNLKEIKKL